MHRFHFLVHAVSHRRPTLLVADPKLTFMWTKPTIFFKPRPLPGLLPMAFAASSVCRAFRRMQMGEQHLRDFQDNEKTIPTTSQKLSTGVNAQNIRNIVLRSQRDKAAVECV